MGVQELMRPPRHRSICISLMHQWANFDKYIFDQADDMTHSILSVKSLIDNSRGNLDHSTDLNLPKQLHTHNFALLGNFTPKGDVDSSKNIQSDIHNIQNFISTYQESSDEAMNQNEMDRIMRKRYGSPSPLFGTDCALYKEQFKKLIQEIGKIQHQSIGISKRNETKSSVLTDWYSGKASIGNETNKDFFSQHHD